MIKEVKKGRNGKYCICICDYCLMEFKRDFNTAVKSKHNFCNYFCMGKWQSENLIGEKATTFGYKHTKKAKEKIRIGHIGLKMSEKNRIELIKRMSGKNSHRWKGGRRKDKDGYILVYIPNHPNANRDDNFILEHRLIMENYLGRHLSPNEIIHHINMDKSDNRIENLYLYSDNGHHTKDYFYIKDLIKELLNKEIVEFKEGKYIIKNKKGDELCLSKI